VTEHKEWESFTKDHFNNTDLGTLW